MKPNLKDYLRAVGKFISILLVSIAIFIAFLGVMYLCMRYVILAVIVCLGVAIALVGGFVVSTVYDIAKEKLPKEYMPVPLLQTLDG